MAWLGERKAYMVELIDRISIPLWFGWECNYSEKGNAPTLISIPLWFGWEQGDYKVIAGSTEISIPLWFGWEIAGYSAKTAHVIFQFHYGSVGRLPGRLVGYDIRNFNSTMVRLGEQ